MLLRIMGKGTAPRTRILERTSGIFGQGMVHMARWIPCRNPGMDWAWALVADLGKECVNGVQALGARDS